MNKEDLVKDYIETQPKLVQHFSQGFLVNAIKENITTAISNFGNRSQHINSAIQNIEKLKPTSIFNLGVRDEAVATYSKYKVVGDQVGHQDDDQDDEVLTESGNPIGTLDLGTQTQIEDAEKSDEQSDIEIDSAEGNQEQGEDNESDQGDVQDISVTEDEIIEDEIIEDEIIEDEIIEDEDIKAEIANEEEIRVDKNIKAIAGDLGVFLTVGNTAYTLGGKLVSFVLTKPTIDKNEFVDDTYKSGDLFTLETPIELT